MSNEHPPSPAGTEGPENQITVVIPAYNEEGTIGAVVLGVRKKLPEARILVIDDGSSDWNRCGRSRIRRGGDLPPTEQRKWRID